MKLMSNLWINSSRRRRQTTAIPPPPVYEAVVNWAGEHLDIGNRPVVRPFYPGGDFEHFDYPDNCVVIDNPPFSIFSKICNWYVERGIPFLLFAPAMSSIKQNVTYIGVSCTITYENGANVGTAFVTNMMGDIICTTAPDLHKAVKKANDDNLKQSKKALRNTTQYRKFERIYCIHNGKIVLTKKPD